MICYYLILTLIWVRGEGGGVILPPRLSSLLVFFRNGKTVTLAFWNIQ